MTDTPHIGLPYIDAAQSQKHVTHNDGLQILDALVQLSVLARDVNAPPAAPAVGARYIVGAAPTGAFATHVNAVATWQDGVWRFLTPRAGWIAFIESDNSLRYFNGALWSDFASALHAFANLDSLGIGASADAANPLLAKLNATLFTAKSVSEGGSGDLRFKLNKSAAANVVSQLYQDNYSGRAETGLIGDDHFRVKVSPDGATWRNAIDVDPATGLVSFPAGVGEGTLAGFRNRLRNASFAINQRVVSGTVSLAAGAYGHDGVRAGAAGATYTFAASGIDTTITITAGTLILPVEATLIEGGACMLSQAGSAQARVWQGAGFTGTGSYASPPLTTAALAAATQTNVEFSTGTLLRPQLESGAVATIFERRPPGIELAICKRYFQTMNLSIQSPAAGSLLYTYTFPVEMRATPTTANVAAGSTGSATITAEAAADRNGGPFQVNASAPGGYVVFRVNSFSAEL